MSAGVPDMSAEYLTIMTFCIFLFLTPSAYGQIVEIITERGNVFAVDMWKDDETQSMLDGLGINSRIIHHDLTGSILYGQNMHGRESPIMPYVHLPPETRFVAALNDKHVTTYLMPEPYAEYVFDGTKLDKRSPGMANILGYTYKRTISGDIDVESTDDKHITVSGTGRLILRLSDPGTILINGTAAPGTTMRIVKSPYDLIGIQHDPSRGFLIHYAASDPGPNTISVPAGSVSDSVTSGVFQYIQSAELVVYHGKCCKGRYIQTGQFTITVEPSLVTTGGSSGYYEITGDTTTPVPMDPDSITLPGAKILHINSNTVHSFEHWIYDTLPVRQVGSALQGDFNAKFENLTGVYLVVDSAGGRSSIGGSVISDMDFLTISGLVNNTAYRITSGNDSIMTGITTGLISMKSFEMPVSKTDLRLHIYDNAVIHRSHDRMGMLVIDHLNGQRLAIDSSDDLVYNIHAYVKIPVVGNAVIRQVNLDGMPVPGLDNNYANGESVFVPIIPEYRTLGMMINGIEVYLDIADILGGTGLKISDPKSHTVSISQDDAIHQVESTVGLVTYMIAASDGHAKAHVRAAVSGDSEITNIKTYFKKPPPPPPPQPRDPMTTWIEVYVNGKLQHIDGSNRTQIFFSNSPAENHKTGTLGQHSAYHTARFSYDETLVLDTLSVPVAEADFVEFYFYNRIHAEGSVPPTPAGFSVHGISGSATATASLEYASINTSM